MPTEVVLWKRKLEWNDERCFYYNLVININGDVNFYQLKIEIIALIFKK